MTTNERNIMEAINLATDQLVVVVLPYTIDVIAKVYGADAGTLLDCANSGKVFYLTSEDRCIDFDELEAMYTELVDAEHKPTFVIRRK